MNYVIGIFLTTFAFFGIEYRGIHEQEWHEHQGEKITVSTPDSALPLQIRERLLRKDIYGYYPYWMGTSYNTLQYDLLSHIAYFSVSLDGAGNLGSIPNPTILDNLRNIAHSNGVMVTITATQFDDAVIENLLNSSSARTNAVNNLYTLVENNSLDGVSIDFEFPSNSVKDSLTLFMTELTDYFHTNLPGSHISIATPAVDWGNGFDYDQLALNSDGLFIMAYNYYWSGSAFAGPVSPLPSSSLWGTYSVMWTVNNYIQYGIYTEKFIIGFPYYGFRWPTESDSIKSPTRGNGSALTYTSADDSAALYMKLWDDTSKTVWYTNYLSGDGWYQCWFDDSLSLRMKYQVIIDSTFGGAGIWALGYDGSKPELWGALRDAFYYTHTTEQKDKRPRKHNMRLSATPNPFSTSTTITLHGISDYQSIKESELHIYDLAGRMVREISLFPFSFSLGAKATWDGRDHEGRTLPAGTYFCIFASEEYEIKHKIHIIR